MFFYILCYILSKKVEIVNDNFGLRFQQLKTYPNAMRMTESHFCQPGDRDIQDLQDVQDVQDVQDEENAVETCFP